MQKIRSAGKFIGMLFLLGMLWFAYTILEVTSVNASSENLNYIPESATTVYRLNGRIFLKEAISSILFHEDQELADLIREISKKRTTDKIKPLGISFESDIVYFVVPDRGQELQGYLFNLHSPVVFKKNLKKYISDKATVATNGNVGLVLVQGDNLLSKKELERFAKQLLRKKTSFAKKYNFNDSSPVFSIWRKSKDGSVIQFSGKIEANTLRFNGRIFAKLKRQKIEFGVRKQGTHFESLIIPDSWNVLLRQMLEVDENTLPDLTSIAINYHGCKIISDPDFFVAPKIDAVLTFKKPVSVDSLFARFKPGPSHEKLALRPLNIYGVQYVVMGDNSTTIGIFSKHPESFYERQSSSIFELSGDPKNLFNIEGEGLVLRLVKMSALFNASSKIADKIKNVSLKAEPSGDHFKISGVVEFDQNEFPMNALFKFLIRSKILE